MQPLNDALPICPLTRFLERVTEDTILSNGDVLYTEWYGDNDDNLGDVRDRNRFRLGVAHNIDTECKTYSGHGNDYVWQLWFKNLQILLKAMPMGSGGCSSYDTTKHKFTSTWRVGDIGSVIRLFNKELSIPDMMRIMTELSSHLEQTL